MKNRLLLLSFAILFTFSGLSAQSFLKKLGDVAKKVTNTEQEDSSKKQEASATDSNVPLSINIESTRTIGDRVLISGKLTANEDVRIRGLGATAITSDGSVYECVDLIWTGNWTTNMSFDNNFTADIPYSFDLIFDTKNKAVNSFISLTLNPFNHTAQKHFKIELKNIVIPVPVDPNLSNPSVIEIEKNVYLRWTKAEESASGLKLNFVVENKGSDDKEVRFLSYNNAKMIDKNGVSYDAELTLKDRVNFPVDIPVAGSISVDKPLKMDQIALLEFSSHNFKYKIKKIVLP